MKFIIQGTNVELTDERQALVESKLSDAFRALGDMDTEAIRVDVELERSTQRHKTSEVLYRAEANVTMPGRFIRAEASAKKLDRAVVELKHILARKLRSWRERLIDQRHQGARMVKERYREGGEK